MDRPRPWPGNAAAARCVHSRDAAVTLGDSPVILRTCDEAVAAGPIPQLRRT